MNKCWGAALLLAACLNLPLEVCAAADVLRVGVIQSLSGIAAEDGSTAVQALQLAAEEINKTAETRVELLIEDDATDAVRSATAYRKLKEQDVHAIIGPTWSFTANAVLPLAGADGMVLINTATLPECLESQTARGFSFSTATTVEEHAKAFGRYLDRHPAGSVIIFYTNNRWGEAQRAAFAQTLASRGATIVNELPSTAHENNDWRILLPQEKSLNADLWLLLLNKVDLDTVIKRARELKVPARLYASYHFADTLRLARDKELFEGVCYSYPEQETAAELEFAAKFRKRYGQEPRFSADNTYDALFLLRHAYKLSKQKQIALHAALKEIEMQGVLGKYDFSDKMSFSVGKASSLCVTGGALINGEM